MREIPGVNVPHPGTWISGRGQLNSVYSIVCRRIWLAPRINWIPRTHQLQLLDSLLQVLCFFSVHPAVSLLDRPLYSPV